MDFAMRPSSSSSSTSSRHSFGADFVVVTLLFGCWCCCYHGIPVVEAFALVSTSTSSTTTPTSSSTRSSIAASPTWSAHRRRHYATFAAVSTSASASTSTNNPSSSSMFVPDPATAALKQELYTLCAGTRNGVDADAGRKQEIQRVVTELEVLGQQRWTEYQQQHTATTAEGNEQEQEQEAVTMTDVSLRGSRHELIYCESEGGSSGKIGPFVGYVEQIFADEDATNFINAVTLGPLQLALAATRTRVPDGIRYRVKFQHITVTIFGITVVTKPITGSGIWTSRFVDNELRIIDTPSLFIIRRLQDDDQKQHPQQQKSSASSSPSLVDILKNPADFIADDE